MTVHMVIPDTQVKPDCDYSHMIWAAKYAVDKRPDVIVHLGDHWDMPSLSSYDVGTKSFEGRRYFRDVQAGNEALRAFTDIIDAEINRRENGHRKRWNPRLVFLFGNHEHRIVKAVNKDPKLDGWLSYDDLDTERWETVPFLEPIVIDGIAYCHYFTSGVMGRPVPNARVLLQKKHMSCIMGHVQDRDIAFARKADGTRMTGLFAGIYYQHDEEYLNAQTNGSWAGIWMLHEVNNGSFDDMPVSLQYLKKRYS